MRLLMSGLLGLVAISSLAPIDIVAQDASDESSITRLIADRQAAWNSGDGAAYARLLTPDADISSATGRIARGRDAVVQLYQEQRAGAYAGASTTSRITHIRLIRPDVAIVDASFENSGIRGNSGPSQGKIVFVVAKQPDQRWLITAIRGIPGPPAPTGK